ncbi:MAG: MFS transporter [Anaerolineales bacterium]|nr:MFS transporter [Anaerolineales bacterium]
MLLHNGLRKINSLYQEYPKQFWVIVGAGFIDRVGGALIFPFFALYITRHFEVGMTEVGLMFAIFSVADMFGNMIGGALTDFLGRKGMIIMGLVISGMTSLGMGLVQRLDYFYVMGLISGLFATASGPAHQAMMMDILPEEKWAEGFGVRRVSANLAVAIGPAIGGFVASYSYLVLFAADTITSLITAVIVFLVIAESRPAEDQAAEKPSFLRTFAGYGEVIKDRTFMAFVMISTVATLVYSQMYSTLSVFLRDVHGVPEAGYGWLMTLNAGMVVAFQFLITRKFSDRPPLVVMALGSLFYVIGFGMYGFSSFYLLFMIAMAVITVGEMVMVPVAQAYVGDAAPEDMRGRYSGVMGFSWMVPWMIGPLLAGLIMDYGDPNWIWYGCALLGTVAVLGFLALDLKDREVKGIQGRFLSVISRRMT